MIYIKIPENLKAKLSVDKRGTITSDETFAFTEQPRTQSRGNAPERIEPHKLFELFTSNIIAENTTFTR